MRKWILGLTLAFLVVFTLDLYPGLRGGGGWQWTFLRTEDFQNGSALAILALALVVYVAGAVLLRNARRVSVSLAWAVLGGTVLAVAVVGVNGDAGFHLFTRTVSPVQTGGSALAVRVMADEGAQATLNRWTEVMSEALNLNLIHFTTSPPGQPLFHYGLAQIADAPAFTGLAQPVSMALRPYQCTDIQVMNYTRGEIVSAGIGMLMPFFAALAVIPLFFAVRILTGDPRTAARVAGWFPLVPSVLLFAPTWNTLYPALCVAAFALLAYGLTRRKMPFVLLGGVVMSLTLFLNFAVLPILGLFGFFTLGYWYFIARHEADTPNFLWAVRAGVWFAAGLLSVWVIFAFATGYTPLDILAVTFDSHRDLVQRNYFEWLILHPYDTALFLGLPLTALFVWGVWLAIRRKSPTIIDIAAIATALTVILLNISGLVQGENGRILSFYAPFFLIAAAGVFGRAPRWDVPLMVVQAGAVFALAATLYTVPLDLNPQRFSPREDIGGLGDTVTFIPSEAVFESGAYAGQFALNQYRYVADPSAQAITFEFQWDGLAPTERPYQFELVATAENEIDGVITSDAFRWYPQAGGYLTPCWRAGDAIRDTVVLRLPPVAMPVVWEVTLRAVDERTGDVMRVALPEGAQGDALTLAPVRYP